MHVAFSDVVFDVLGYCRFALIIMFFSLPSSAEHTLWATQHRQLHINKCISQGERMAYVTVSFFYYPATRRLRLSPDKSGIRG